MKPLCEKFYFERIAEFVLWVVCTFFCVVCVTHVKELWVYIGAALFLAFVAWRTVVFIYWIFQPNVLIYQHETGIVIRRNVKIEYTEIEAINYKCYYEKDPRQNTFHEDPHRGIIIIKLKSGTVYKLPNAQNPVEVVNTLTKIKQQRKFR
jgi:hypothetical protein